MISVLLGALFFFFVQSSRLEKQLAVVRAEILRKQHLQMRLEGLFSSIVLPHRFYTERGALIAIFDNGIDPDPLFSGPVVGKLALDEAGELALSIQPLVNDRGKKSPTRKEILFQGSAELAFFTGKGWVSEWPKKNGHLPVMARVFLASGERLAFSFLTHEPIATYR